MKKSLLLIFVLSYLTISGCSNKGATSSKNGATEITWVSYDEAVKMSKKKSKKIFIDVYTDWCGWCKQLDKTTFKDPDVVQYMNEKYYAVKLNAEGRGKLTYDGMEMTEQELAKRIYKISGYPSSVYLDKNQKLLQVIPGFIEASMFKKVLKFYAEDHYTKTSWEQFQNSN